MQISKVMSSLNSLICLLRAPDNHRIIKRIHFHEKKEMARIAVKVSQRPGESNTNLHLCCEYVTGGLL